VAFTIQSRTIRKREQDIDSLFPDIEYAHRKTSNLNHRFIPFSSSQYSPDLQLNYDHFAKFPNEFNTPLTTPPDVVFAVAGFPSPLSSPSFPFPSSFFTPPPNKPLKPASQSADFAIGGYCLPSLSTLGSQVHLSSSGRLSMTPGT